MTWTQPFCDDCYLDRVPNREPYRIRERFREVERCAGCGQPTRSGIYLRTDPAKVPFPRIEEN